MVISIVTPCTVGLVIGIFFLNVYLGLYNHQLIRKLQTLDTIEARRKVVRLAKLEESGKLFVLGRYTYLGRMIVYPVVAWISSVVAWTYLTVGAAGNRSGMEPVKIFTGPTQGSQMDVEAAIVGTDIEMSRM